MNILEHWLRINNVLTLNTKKTHYMIMTSKNNLEITLNVENNGKK